MFFYLSTNQFDVELLPEIYSDGGTTLFLDDGWSVNETVIDITWRKGYSLDCKLENVYPLDPCRGHYCVIQHNKEINTWEIYHDTLRGFPIYYDKHNITNLMRVDKELKVNQIVSIISSNINVSKTKNKIQFFYSPNSLTSEAVAELIRTELTNNILDYLKYNNNNLFIHATGGYDCTVLRAILENENIPCVVKENWRKRQYGHPPFFQHLKETYWGYEQLHTIPDGYAHITGYMGDEYIMRNPGYVAYVLHCYGVSLADYLISYKAEFGKSYMTAYIDDRQYMEKINKTKPDDLKLDDVFKVLLLDYQMWHYNNQITFMPYKSIKIIEYGFSLDIPGILEQITEVGVQKKIIESINPKMLDFITPYKNIAQKG